jgi:transcription elongation factor GreA
VTGRPEEGPEVPITREGLADVKRQLEQLTGVRRPEIVARIKAAREHGDLSENFEYHAARNEQSFLETRIRELEAIVQHHVVIESTGGNGEVGLLNRVTIEEEGSPAETYSIVGPAEADPANGKISFESAIGRALMGRRTGDEVEVVTPSGGTYLVRIARIE